MGELKRSDIVGDDLLAAPLILTQNFEKLLPVLDQVIAKGLQMNDNAKNTNLSKVKQETSELNKEQEQLAKIQGQIATEAAKSTDAYRAYAQQLKNLKEENKNATATQDSWVKSVTAANSSLVKLEDALNKNRVAYSNLRNEQERQSKTGKDLLAVIQRQAVEQDNLRTKMGQTTQRVGGYTEAIEKALPALKKINPEIVESGEAVASMGGKFAAAASLVAIPFLLIASAVTVGKKSLESYFENSVEGADTANKATSAWSATVEVLTDKFESLGKSISETLGLDKGSIQGLQTAYLSYLGLTKLAAEIAQRTIVANDVAEKQNELRKEEILLTVELSKVNLEKDKELFEARDRVRNSDQERYDALLKFEKLNFESRKIQTDALNNEITLQRDVIKLKGFSIKDDQTALDLLDDASAKQHVAYGDILKLAQLEAKRFDIENTRYQGARRRQALEKTLIDESIKRELDFDKQIQEATITTGETIYKHQVATNAKRVGNQEFSLEEQLSAQQRVTEAEVNLNDLGIAKQIQAVRQAAFDRIQLTRDETDEIFAIAGKDFKRVIELTIEAKNKKLEADGAYIAQSQAITEEGQRQDQKIIKDGANKTAKTISDNYEYYITLQRKLNKEDTNESLKHLDEKFSAGEISLHKYNIEHANILREQAQRDANIGAIEYREELQALKTYLEGKKELTDEEGKLLSDVTAKLSDEELKQTQLTAAQKLELKQKENAALIQLQQGVFDAFKQIGDDQFAYQEAQVNKEINLLNEQKDKEIAQAGDNKNAKLQIEKEFNQKIKEEQKKLQEIQHRQAVYDKAIAAFEILVKTGEGVAQALAYGPPGIPLAVTIAALGAIQETIVLAKPIPAYAGGIDSAPGGFAIVNDGNGPELIREGNQYKMYDVPGAVLTHLKPGSEVFTANESAAIFKDVSSGISDIRSNQIIVYKIDDARIVSGLDRIAENMPDVVSQANELYKVKTSRDGNSNWRRYKIFGY